MTEQPAKPAETPIDTSPSKKLAWLTPGVRGIGSASFLADLGHEIPTALLPSLLSSSLGASAAALGILEGVADGMAGIARLAGGTLADDPQRRRATAIGGYTSTAVLSALIGVTNAVWQVGLLRIAAWTSRGLRVPARNALLADVVPAEAYGRAYGFERAMDNLGAIGGPLAALGLVALVGVRWAILLSVIPGLLATLAILYAIRHIPQPKNRERTPLRLQIRPVLRGQLGQVLIGVAIFEMGHVAATLLILRATQLLTPGLGENTATQIALGLYVAYNVAATVASIPAGQLGDRLGSIGVLTVGVALFFLAYVGFAVETSSLFILAPAFMVAGVAIGCVETSQHAAVASFASPSVRGSAFGLLAAVQSFGNIVASAVAGILWTAFSPTVAFSYIAVWSIVAVIVLFWLGLNAKNANSSVKS
jgi:MFS family permease